VNRFRPLLRLDKTPIRLPVRPAYRQAGYFLKQSPICAIRVMAPTLLALSLASVSHAQGTMDFSGAQTLMGTFQKFAAFLRRADESTLGRAVVEAVILLTASRGNASHALRDAATAYKVDADAIAAKVKQEFSAREKAKRATIPAPKVPVKAQPKTAKKAAAA
jgi:hypothetical protein